MPIVDYNRIYRVRSQERKPITNPVTGPDAAGAFLRGAVPAALAPMHGLNARINAIRGETDARNRRDALRLEGIASGIRAAGDAYQTYIRAMERRDAAELDKLEAAYSAHMISGEDGAYGTRRETSDGTVTNGPGAAIRQLDRDFEETDAYKAANRRVKNAFAPRREARRAVYFAKGDRIQFEAARAEHAQAVKDKADNDDIAVSRNLDPYNYRTWKEQMEIAIESDQHQLRLGMGLVEMQADGTERAIREPTEEERRTLANQRLAKRDAYILQRAIYYGNLIANDDGNLSQTPHLEAVLEAIANNAGLSVGQNADDGMPDSDVAFANESIASPLVRQKIGEILTNARQQRERNVERLDTETQKQLVEAAADLVGKTEAANPSEVFKFADDATAAAMKIRDESKRATALKRIDGAVGIVEFASWADRLAGVLDDFNNIGNGSDAKTAQKDLRDVADVIGTMRSESGKTMAQQALTGAFKGRREDIGRKVSEVLERGWYFDRDAGRWQPLTREQALDLFQNNIVFMDQDARDKARKALDKGRPRMTADSIAALNTFLGANQAQNLFDWDKVGSSEDGDMAYAPKDDWGKRGTIDIWNGRRDVDVDRAMAKKIWTIAERWQDLMRSGAVKPDSKGKFPTLDQYLDQQLKDDDEWRNWRDSTIAERVEKTMELLDTQVDSMFYATPNR